MNKIIFLLTLIILINFSFTKETKKQDVIDLLWSSQRQRLLIWGVTLNYITYKNNDINIYQVYENFNKLNDEEMRTNIEEILKTNFSFEMKFLNKNPDQLDNLSKELKIKEIVDKNDRRFGFHFEENSNKLILPEMKGKIENMNHDELIILLKKIDGYIKRGRYNLTQGVLKTCDKMTNTQIKNWIYKKISQNPNLNN